MAVNLIIKNNVRKAVKELDKEIKVPNVADEVIPELNKKVEDILKQALKRAVSNQRRTLQARDL